MSAATYTVESLKCEYQSDPLTIDSSKPRLSWITTTSQQNWRQAAYQILVSRSSQSLARGHADLWDSGRVASDASIQIEYDGVLLKSQEAAVWKVRVWAEGASEPIESAPATWETGLLDRADWVGQWIGSTVVGGPRTTTPAPYLRKTFALQNKRIRHARLYATALGIYEASLNGRRVSRDVFRPRWTEYTKRVQYNAYDATALLSSGENVLGAILGDGCYCGRVQAQPRQQYGDRPKFLAQLAIEFDDGSTQIIATDNTWRTTTGPILAADMIGGEHYDARLELPGWNARSFDDAAWQSAKTFADPGIAINASLSPPVRPITEIAPIAPVYPAASSGWAIADGQFTLDVTVPPNASAKVFVPVREGAAVKADGAEAIVTDGGASVFEIGSGTYRFSTPT